MEETTLVLMRVLSVAILLCHCAAAQIVQNAANPQIQEIIVPGSLINVSIVPANGQLPVLNPATVSVQIDSEQAQIVSVQGATVLALVPSDVPLGPGTVVLKTAMNITAPVVYVNVVASDFGLFTNSSGIGQAIAQKVALGSVGTNNLTHPAHPGDYVTLYGTGLGSAAEAQVAVLLGGHPAPVSYAGHAPSLPGVDQINFQVPADLAIPNGCFVAVQVVVNGVASNQASVSKAAAGAGACSPPIDLTAAQMAQLDAGQSLPFVSFSIDGLISSPPGSAGLVRNESFNVEPIQTNEASIAVMSQPLVADDVFYSCSASSGGAVAKYCRVWRRGSWTETDADWTGDHGIHSHFAGAVLLLFAQFADRPAGLFARPVAAAIFCAGSVADLGSGIAAECLFSGAISDACVPSADHHSADNSTHQLCELADHRSYQTSGADVESRGLWTGRRGDGDHRSRRRVLPCACD